MQGRLILWGLVFVILLSGCAPLADAFPTLTPEDTATPIPPTATPTFTPTIIWFPPTETPTPLPAAGLTPTPDFRAGLGPLAFSDDFTDPELWITSEIGNNSITVMNGDITLQLDQPRGGIYAFRFEPLMNDFFMEITASPSYCGPEDEYGLMLRVTGVIQDHYRLALSCQGRVSLFRVVNERALQIVEPVSHPLLPTSFPSSSRLGVWVQGRTLRFYLNDIFIFSVEDAVILRGAVGVYTWSRSEDPALINFSDLKVYELPGDE